MVMPIEAVRAAPSPSPENNVASALDSVFDLTSQLSSLAPSAWIVPTAGQVTVEHPFVQEGQAASEAAQREAAAAQGAA